MSKINVNNLDTPGNETAINVNADLDASGKTITAETFNGAIAFTSGINTTGLTTFTNISITGGSISGLSTISATTITATEITGGIGFLSAQSASGTTVDFTGIPSWAKRVTVMLDEVSLNGSEDILCQIGNGSFQTTGYTGYAANSNGTQHTRTDGFVIFSNASSHLVSGHLVMQRMDYSGTSVWMAESRTKHTSSSAGHGISYTSVTGGNIDRVRLTAPTNSFDSGSINVMYEG